MIFSLVVPTIVRESSLTQSISGRKTYVSHILEPFDLKKTKNEKCIQKKKKSFILKYFHNL